MSETIYHWRVYCEDDAKFEYIWDTVEPTTCPANPVGHTITQSLTSVVDKIDPNIVQIQEEFVSTQGIYQFEGFKQVIPAGTPGAVTTIDLVWPHYPITLLNGGFDGSAAQVGDEIRVCVAPDQIIGALTANAGPGSTVLNVSPTVIDNIYTGYRVKLFDGVNSDDCGLCIAKNTVNGTITVETAPVNTFLAASPTYVKITVDVIKSLHIGSVRPYTFANKKVGGKAIPANTIIRVLYTNNDGVQKDFIYNLELMY